jgi:hypothetical protein
MPEIGGSCDGCEVWDPQEGFCRKRIVTLGLIKCIRRPAIECCNMTSSTQAFFSI